MDTEVGVVPFVIAGENDEVSIWEIEVGIVGDIYAGTVV